MNLLLRCALLASVLLGLANCGDQIAELINKAFPPVDRTETALASLDKAEASLGHMKSSNISVFSSSSDVSPALKSALTKVKDLTSADITFGPQRIAVDAQIDKALDQVETRVRGRVQGYILVSTDATSLIARPILDGVVVSHVETKRTDIDVLVPAINAALHAYLDNLNGQIPQITIPISMDQAFDWKFVDDLARLPGAKDVSANDVKMRLVLSAASILIDEAGIRAIAEAEAIPLGTMSVTEKNAICASPQLPIIDCPTMNFFAPLEKLSCGVVKAEALVRQEARDEARSRFCSELASAAKNTQPEPIGPRNDDELKKRFAAYQDRFASAQKSILGTAPLYVRTHAAVTKAFIAYAVNEALADPAVHIVLM